MVKVFILAFLSLVSSFSFALTIIGSGSTFAEPIYSRLFSDFQKINKSVQFNYQGIGSGAGVKQLMDGIVDFAGTDDPMKAEDEAKAKETLLHIPIALGAVVVSYNLPVKENLVLNGDVLGKIFDGQINKWNHPEIAKLNPKVVLPDLAILVATRSDSSGTTAVFSEYLAKVNPSWKNKNGKTVKWFKGSVGGKGNAGVAGLVKQNKGAIGYVELVYATENNISFAQLINQKGEIVTANDKSVGAAAQGNKKDAVAHKFKISLTDSSQKGAYPITAFTWMLVFEKMPKSKGAEIVNFAKWALGEEAQKTISAINFSQVPNEIRTEALKAVGQIELY